MASSGVDFLTQYKTISNKLKNKRWVRETEEWASLKKDTAPICNLSYSSHVLRRFLRKPNVAEASEQFSYLAKQLQQQECPQYAAFSCLALARCEQTISNPAGEAQALIQGARLFLEEEMQNYDLRCPTFNEHLNAAINCYNHAIRVYMEHEHYGLAAALCLELGNALRKCNKTSEAMTYYQRGAELVSKSPLECLNAKDLLVTCCIEIGDYDQALALLTEMTQTVEHCGRECNSGKRIGAFTDYLVKCEVTRVLLLLLLCPGPQRLQPEHSQLLEKYAWEMTDFDATASWLGEDLFLLLQSVVVRFQNRYAMMAHQSNDLESLKVLQVDLWPFLNCQQNDLLQMVVKSIFQKKG